MRSSISRNSQSKLRPSWSRNHILPSGVFIAAATWAKATLRSAAPAAGCAVAVVALAPLPASIWATLRCTTGAAVPVICAASSAAPTEPLLGLAGAAALVVAVR
jgi:hypothetical protein